MKNQIFLFFLLSLLYIVSTFSWVRLHALDHHQNIQTWSHQHKQGFVLDYYFHQKEVRRYVLPFYQCSEYWSLRYSHTNILHRIQYYMRQGSRFHALQPSLQNLYYPQRWSFIFQFQSYLLLLQVRSYFFSIMLKISCKSSNMLAIIKQKSKKRRRSILNSSFSWCSGWEVRHIFCSYFEESP